MVEVIVASVLFAASAAGIFATVAMTKGIPKEYC
jgi:archaellum component FlaG (FlaF/FlaG flagellin family)